MENARVWEGQGGSTIITITNNVSAHFGASYCPCCIHKDEWHNIMDLMWSMSEIHADFGLPFSISR